MSGEGSPSGRVVITWPSDAGRGAVAAWGITIEDADSGELILDAVSMRISVGTYLGWTDTVVGVELTRLVDAAGEPIGNAPGAANTAALTEEYAEYRRQRGLDKPHRPEAFPSDEFTGQKLRTADFRYVVAEMRVGEPYAPGGVIAAQSAITVGIADGCIIPAAAAGDG